MKTVQATELCRYRYDPLDRLVSTLLAGQDSTMRFYNKSRLTTEIQGQIKYSFFQHEDLPLAQHRLQGRSSDTTLLVTDPQRSVLHAATSGQRKPIAYSPYGHRPAENGALNLLGFNGEQPDPVTGHYLLGNGYRAFNPVLMRFNSPDSLSPFDEGGFNTYAYALGNPVNRIDPTGHFASLVSKLPFAAGGLALGGLALGIAGYTTHNEALVTAGVGMLVAGIFVTGGYLIGSTTRVSNIQRLRPDFEDIAVGIQNLSKGRGKRLIINGHGLNGTVGYRLPKYLAADVLEKYPDFNRKFKDVKLLACHGADGANFSVGQQLSDIFNKPVKAYGGVARADLGMLEAIKKSSTSETRYFTKSEFPVRTTINSGGTVYPYSPTTFQPHNIRNQ